MREVRLGAFSKIVEFQASDGLVLKGLLSGKKRGNGSCMIVIHGMSGSAFSSVPLALAGNMPRNFDVLLFNNRGYGMLSGFSRQVGRTKKRMLIGTNMERFEECVYDIAGALSAMKKLGYRKFVICGHSTGCQKAAYYMFRTKDNRVSAAVFVAPCDDYNLIRSRLGNKYGKVKENCRRMIMSGHGNKIAEGGSGFSAQRLDSVINHKRPEARIFDYSGRLDEFRAIKKPILTVFGENEENMILDIREAMEILRSKTDSSKFSSAIIPGADHSFEGMESALAEAVWSWVKATV